MIIYIARHGEAEPKSSSKPDEARSITDSGAGQVRRIFTLARQWGAIVDLILSSPILRAKQSAEIASSIFGLKGFQVMNSLEPTMTPYEVYADLSKLESDKRVILVSHQPLVSSLVSDLLGSDAKIAMPTSSLARIDTDGHPWNGNGTLVFLLPASSGHS